MDFITGASVFYSVTREFQGEKGSCLNRTCRGKGKGKAVPLQACSGPEGSRKLRFPEIMTTAQDVGKVVSLTHRPPLLPGNVPGTHFCQRLSRPQGQIAIGRMTPAGIESASLRFVAQHLNHCATTAPQQYMYHT